MARILLTAARRARSHSTLPMAPGPRGNLIAGILPDFARDPLAFLQSTARDYGPIARIRFGPSVSFLITDPAAIKHVLQDNHRNYRRNEFSNNVLKMFVGESVLTSEGEHWLRQRRLMQPAFHRQRIASFGETMTRATVEMLDRWYRASAESQPLDIASEMMRLTLRIAGETLFSVDLSSEASELGRSMTEGMDFFNYRSRTLLPAPLWLPTSRNRRFRASRRVTDRIVDQIIEQRRSDPHAKADLLAMLMEARDEETGEGMTNEQLRSEVITMIAAGHETTANALTWTFYLLSQNPEATTKLHAELDRVLDNRVPTVADLPSLPYTRTVIDEAMRLYPPAWTIARQVNNDDEIGGCFIPANSGIIMSAYVTHRDPAQWDDPERFEPERFNPERSAGRPRYAYFPFGGGPHLCIGNMFALTEAQLVLATISQYYSLHLVAGQDVAPEPMITLRPRDPIMMSLEAR